MTVMYRNLNIDLQRDLEDIEAYILDTGHFALEEDREVIAQHISRFLGERQTASV